MSTEWLILHGGALGDLALMLRFALHLPGVDVGSTLRLVSRTDPGDLETCAPSIRRRASEGTGLHWLFTDGDQPPPKTLAELVAGRRVLNALAGPNTPLHRRLRLLSPEAVFSVDPRPEPEARTHILKQWRGRLEQQGLLVPKCIHQHRGGPRLHVPEAWRAFDRSSVVQSAPKRPIDGRSIAGETNADRSVAAHSSSNQQNAAHSSGNQPNAARPIIIHPGSGGRSKCWPLPCFLSLAHRLRAGGAAVCFLLGPVELELWPDEVLNSIRAEFETRELPRPSELVRLLAAARCLVGNDSGPAHLAALLDTPTVTIFGPTAASVWRPIGTAARVIQGRAAASRSLPESRPTARSPLVTPPVVRMPDGSSSRLWDDWGITVDMVAGCIQT